MTNMGETSNPQDLSLGDPDLEHLLDAPDDEDQAPQTSTPAASPNRPSDLPEDDDNDSMPSLESVTDYEADSGNSSGEEPVIKNFESDSYKLYFQPTHDYLCRLNSIRNPRQARTTEDRESCNDSPTLEEFMVTNFIHNYLSKLFIIYYSYIYSGTSESNVFLSFNFDINME